jgi:hypothetical protein
MNGAVVEPTADAIPGLSDQRRFLAKPFRNKTVQLEASRLGKRVPIVSLGHA